MSCLGADGEREALALDGAPDPGLRRDEFSVPVLAGRPVAYFAGNSLGLQPRRAAAAVREVLDSWGALGVAGHLEGAHPWMPYHEELRATSARLVGARPGETVVMNGLTVNLHLLMNAFYRPDRERYRIVVEHDAFPSDRYAVDSQAALHGFAPADAVIALRPRAGEVGITPDVIADLLERDGTSIALLLLGGVNFRTGALLDIPAITRLGRDAGVTVGWDLAHAAGNVALELHDWDVDFAAWCSYKYLNAGPGSIGGCFVHERHAARIHPAGWWGHDPASRFAMPETFVSQPGVEGWQLSNPPILSMAAVRGSLELFDEVGMAALRTRSVRLTAYLEQLLDEVARSRRLRIVTPREPDRRGAQLSVEIDDAERVTTELAQRFGVIADDRPPNIVRFAPAPLYSTFHDCWRAATALHEVLTP